MGYQPSEENHKKFLEGLRASMPGVFRVGLMLHSKGYDVLIMALGEARSHFEARAHMDRGDLQIRRKGESAWLRVEVKHLSAEFKSIEDWPFDDFIVCARHSFDMATPKPYGYVMLNKEKSHAAFVFTRDSEKWTVAEKSDKRYEGYKQEFYFAPLDTVIVAELPQIF